MATVCYLDAYSCPNLRFFGGEEGLAPKIILSSRPLKGTSLHKTASYESLYIKISSAVDCRWRQE